MSTISSISNNQYETNLNRIDKNSAEPSKAAQPATGPASTRAGNITSDSTDIGSAINQLVSTLTSMKLESEGTGPQGVSDDMPSVEEVFAGIDKDGDGTLSQAELLADAPDDLSQEEAKDIFSSFDIDGNGTVSKEEFAADDYAGDDLYLDDTQAAALDVALLDEDASGTLSKTEFLAGRPGDISEDAATKLFGQIDSDGNSAVTIDEMRTSQQQDANLDPSSSAGDEQMTDSASYGPQLSLDDMVSRLQQMAKAYDVTGGAGDVPARSIIV